MISNEDLIKELKNRPKVGNKLLVEKFYEPWVKTVQRTYKIDGLDSEMIVNDSMFKVIRQINKYEFESENKFNNWIFTIIRNTVLDFHRKKKSDKEKLNTVSRDEKFIHEEIPQDETLDENEIDLSNSNHFDEDNFDDSINKNIEELLDQKITTEYLNLYFDSTETKTNTNREFLKEILQEFTLDEQWCIEMRSNHISMKQIAQFRASSEIATKQFVSRLMKKFFKTVDKKLKTNNQKELYENFKKQSKLSHQRSDIKEGITGT